MGVRLPVSLSCVCMCILYICEHAREWDQIKCAGQSNYLISVHGGYTTKPGMFDASTASLFHYNYMQSLNHTAV